MLTCSFCNETKDDGLFTKNKKIKRGFNLCCRSCTNEKQRLSRKSNDNQDTLKYEKTKRGHLVRTYRNMLSRVTGVLKKKAHLYEGLEILDKESFYQWSLSDDMFNQIFDEWVISDYNRKLTPSIDRIDPCLGYIDDNIRWLTHSENSKLGAENQQRSKRNAIDKNI